MTEAEHPFEVLRHFEIRDSDDPAKHDLELYCSRCGEHICDVQHMDTLGVLADVAIDHVCIHGVVEDISSTGTAWL